MQNRIEEQPKFIVQYRNVEYVFDSAAEAADGNVRLDGLEIMVDAAQSAGVVPRRRRRPSQRGYRLASARSQAERQDRRTSILSEFL